jgi:TorA maturation chaperone TorD
MTAEDNQSSAQASVEPLSTALRLIASIFAREVDQSLLEHLIERRDELVGALGRDPLSDSIDDPIEVLAIEYCGLFIGPKGHLVPTESVVLGEGQLWGAATEAVAEFYQRCGIASRRNERTAPDHISMELDFLAILEETGRHAEARQFAHLHLLRWLPGLLDHVGAKASLAFYPVWLEGLQAMLAEEYPPGD